MAQPKKRNERGQFLNLRTWSPFPASNDQEAIYQIRLVINQKREPEIIAEDFALYFVGEYLHEEGIFSVEANIKCPVCLIEDCSSLLVQKEVSK